MDSDFNPFGWFAGAFSLMVVGFLVIFALVIGLFVFIIIRATKQNRTNNAAPEVTAIVTIIDKRAEVSNHGTGLDDNGIGSSPRLYHTYYVSFQQPGGERFELEVPDEQYGLLVVGDQGIVTMKGTRFLRFNRN